jgi:flagellar motor protein MotB
MVKKSILSATLAIMIAAANANAGGVNESIFFIGDDLKSGISYTSTRYENFGDKSYYMGENYDKSKMTYIKPDNYQWMKKNVNGVLQDTLVFPNTNNYAFLSRVDLKEEMSLKKSSEEGELFSLFDGGRCFGDHCVQDENIISIVVPKKFQITAYEAYERNNEKYEYNKNANFKLIDNTLTLYAKDVQGAYVKLWFKDIATASSIYQDVSSSLEKFSEISVSKTDTETRISMPMDNVFDSGKAVAKPIGKQWLKALADAIKDKNFKEIRVEGHTDNTPIKGGYPSNWELSSARASDAVRFMIAQGLDSSKIAAVGYADTRPVAENNSKENRAKNRRIEITVVGNPDSNSAE